MALDSFTPDERVALAVAPFVAGMLLRWLLGRSQFTRWGTAFGTMWFAIPATPELNDAVTKRYAGLPI